jgi:formate hydrogenlyase subunit 3/multisubunit Na+/H+ antiporter MnhD subunit
MAYILLIVFPVAISVSCFILRTQTQLVIAAAIAAIAAQVIIALQIPIDEPARLLGLTVALDSLGRVFLIGFSLVVAVACLVSWGVPHGENFVPVALLMLGFTNATLLMQQEPFVIALLLLSASICAVLAIVDLPTGSPLLVERTSIAIGLKYLVLVVAAGFVMYLAFVLVSIYQPTDGTNQVSSARLILGLLAVGFGLRFAIVPFHSWLLDLVEGAAPMVSAIIIGVVNVTSLLVLISVFQFFPVLVVENERGVLVMQGLGVATAVVGSVLALVQPSIRRMVGGLVIYNAGMTLFSLMTMTEIGLIGALFEAVNQMLAVLLLFLSIALLERPDGRPPNVVRRDLLWRWPVAGSGLIGGALTLIGVPPFAGFAGKQLIFQVAAERGWWFLGLLLLSSILAIVALLRIGQQRLFGPVEEQPELDQPILLGTTELDRPTERRLDPEPRSLALLVCVLLAVCIGVGVYPEPLLATVADVIRGLTFVRAF